MYKIPKEIIEAAAEYRHSLDEVLANKMTPERFRGLRVPWGIYSHRGGQVFMSRIRIPAGSLTSSQLKILAQLAKNFGDDNLHITTRADIQIHKIKLADTAEIIEILHQHQLSPRGGGGNTIRNITVCEAAGICPSELFEVKNPALKLSEYLLKDKNSFNLPRKFKIAFAGCRRGWRSFLTNDLGLLAAFKKDQPGFEVYAGGGMGADCRLAQKLAEFVSLEELGYTVAAVINVFSKRGSRKNKHHNRLRFLIADLGFENFKKIYRQELEEIKRTRKIELRIPAAELKNAGEVPLPAGTEDYSKFLEYNVHPQKQQGYSFVELRIPRGDIASSSLLKLADLESLFPGLEFRTNQNQNLLLCWVKHRDLPKLYAELKKILSDFLYAGTLLDTVACKGALTCNLGLCNSPGLAENLEKMIQTEFQDTRVFKKLDLKLNGCPNACGHHPLGKISFAGMVRRIDRHLVPYYKIYLGRKNNFSRQAGIIAAKYLPDFLKNFLSRADQALAANPRTYEFLEKDAPGIVEELLKNYAEIPAYGENRDFYIDWGKHEEFSLKDLGRGECGAGVIDMIESDLKEAATALAKGETEDLYQALLLLARSLLVTRGIEAQSESQILTQFKENFITSGIISAKFTDLADWALALLKGKIATSAAASYLGGLYREISQAYQHMDTNFNFPAKSAQETKPENNLSVFDLRGVKCPLNYVKAKLKLEDLEIGRQLLLYLDPGEPVENVPASLKNDGQEIIRLEEKNGHFEVLVRRLI